MSSSGDEKGYVYSKLVRINSGAAVTKGQAAYSDTNFIINLGTSMQNIWRVSFLNVVFTNAAYNIRSGKLNSPNNRFTFSTDLGVYNTTVPDGFYNSTQLMAAMTTAINAVFALVGLGQTISFTQIDTNQKIYLTYNKGISVANNFTILTNTDKTDSTWLNLGFSFGTSTTTHLTPLVAENVPNLTGIRQVYLQSSALAPGNQIDEKGIWQNVGLAIPVTASFGAVNVFECKVDQLCQITFQTKRNLSVIDFQLVDDKGNLLDLNGTTMKIELRVWSDTL
jgi:hypothetical protein